MGGAVARFAILLTVYTTGEVLGASGRIFTPTARRPFGPRSGVNAKHAVTQAVEAWDYPQPFDNVASDDMRWMRDEVRHQKYRYDPRSPDWVGLALGKHLGLDPRADCKKLNAILRAWYANGVLAAEIHKDGVRHERKYVVPGNWNDDPDAA